MNILITSAGSGIAFGYATACKNYFSDMHLFTADINDETLITASLFSEKHIKWPAFSDKNYLNYLNNIIKENNIDVFIPIIDNEILFAARNKSKIECHVAVNTEEFCLMAAEKSKYNNFLQKGQVKAVNQITYNEFQKASTAIAKKNFSYGSKSAIIKRNNKHYPFKNDENGYFFYEYIAGDEFTIDCFPFISENKVISSVRRRIEVKSGVCTKAQLSTNKILEDFAFTLMKNFSLTHPYCFQVIERQDAFYLTDINPRLGAGTAMNNVNGMNFFAAHLALLKSDAPEKFFNRIHKDCIVTRQYAEYLSKIIKT